MLLELKYKRTLVQKTPIEELNELESTLVQKGLISKDLLLLMRYFELRELAFLHRMMEYQKIIENDRVQTSFELASRIAEKIIEIQKPQTNLKQVWQDMKDILRELGGMFIPQQQIQQMQQLQQTSTSSTSMFGSSENKPQIKVEIEE
jgi:hypothetical protein